MIREHVVYDSFGNRLSESDYDATGTPIASSHASAVDHLFGYTGREWDADVELQYNRARWYDPTQGRWISQDPIGFEAGDVNLYRYVSNQPVNHIDPSGLVTMGREEKVIEIHYLFENLRITQAVKDEVKRILDDMFKRFADLSYTYRVVYIELQTLKQFNRVHCGPFDDGLFDVTTDKLVLRIRERTGKLGVSGFGNHIGQHGNWGGTVAYSLFLEELRRTGGDRDKILALVLVHELLYHSAAHGHYHEKGYIDAENPKIGGLLSNEACKEIIDLLDAD